MKRVNPIYLYSLLIFASLLICTNTLSIVNREKRSLIVDVSAYFKCPNTIYTIKQVIDLNGMKLVIPPGCTLIFKDNGCLKNGFVIGSDSRIEGKKHLFDNIKIGGSWIVDTISSDMFKDLSSDNSIKNVFALASDSFQNKITIENGKYWISASKSSPNVLRVPSNTNLEINGLICLRPNDLKSYSMLYIKDSRNISIHGRGTVRGDKYEHIGKDGEWGMCVKMNKSDSIQIYDLTLSHAWGDCIYVGSGCKNVNIYNCKLNEGRRQGISIIAGKHVEIKDCKITNVGGTAPECGIDVEPNYRDTVESVWVENVKVKDSRGGLLVCGRIGKDSQIRNVTFKNCEISSDSRFAIRIARCDTMNILECKIKKGGRDTAIYCKNVKRLELRRNKVTCDIIPLKFMKCGNVVVE